MGSALCCLGRADDGTTVCCFCLPWPLFNDNSGNNNSRNINSGSNARQRGVTRVAPVHGRIPLTAPTGSQQHDSMDTFRCPPRPLPYDDPRFNHHAEQHPLVAGHDKDSSRSNKSGTLGESKDAEARSAAKANGSSVKHYSGGLSVPSDSEDDCPICLEEYDYENPMITLQCNHHFHLSCIYEWMERSEACPVCSKVMLFNEGG